MGMLDEGEGAIVHDLATADPTYCDDYLTTWYTLCSAELPDISPPGGRPAPSDHEEDCPWRRAREYVDL